MAATRKERSPLRALTAAALALPGLAHAAEDDEFGLSYSHYREGERSLFGTNTRFDPIEVDSLHARGRVTLADRLGLSFGYVQDTWAGATPITTAPLVLGGNRPTSPDGVSGATPFVAGDLYLDAELRPLQRDLLGAVIGPNTQLVHTLSSASPETRRQGELELGYAFRDARLDLGGGVSFEDDYASRFVNGGVGLDLDQKRTTLSFGASYTWSETDARLDHDAVPYLDASAFRGEITSYPATGDRSLRDRRDDFGFDVGLAQVLTRNAVIESRVGYTRASGYLENPYKAVEVAFIDPGQQFLAPPGGYYAQVRALLEQRPNHRDEWTWDTRYAHYLERFDASLHVGYRLHHDDWSIDAHTLEASLARPLGGGWTITPRARFYSQSEADFYAPYLVSSQAYLSIVTDPDTGDIVSITPFDHALLPSAYASDARLSGFGAFSGGVNLRKDFASGVAFEASFEYYAHRGDLVLGGGGEDDYADYDSYQMSFTLELDESALRAFRYTSDSSPARHAHHGEPAPAGVMLAHALDRAGARMVGYRYTWLRQQGDVLHRTHRASDAEILADGCGGSACRSAPDEMDMRMHMLELGWAPTERVSLWLMPQLVDMRMDLRPLEGAAPDVHGSHTHQTGGVGDLPVVALVRLLDGETHRAHVGLGVSVPLGDVNLDLRRTHQQDRGRIHYGMQLGSGTWDLLPSVTYTVDLGRGSLGAQLSGALRLENENDSGYALGDVVQATAWGSVRLCDWLSASLRAAYTAQDEMSGAYDSPHDDIGPMDFPGSYGGSYWDLGFGLGIVVPGGYLAGNRLAVEWLEPLRDDVEGFQLERRGALFATWSVEL